MRHNGKPFGRENGDSGATMDWVARWNAPGRPGRFRLLLNGRPVEATFGTKGSDWLWHDGGVVEIDSPAVSLALHDLTGFNGRCDAILFARDLNSDSPPEDNDILPRWRRALQGLPETPDDLGPFDLVVAGGGYAGMCAALSAARDGLRVALIQNRPGPWRQRSSEIAVPLRGQIPADGPLSSPRPDRVAVTVDGRRCPNGYRGRRCPS